MTPPRKLEQAGGRGRQWAAAILAALVLALAWAGCGVTPSNYKTLSFFFDGVPNPNSTAAGAPAGADGPSARVMVSSHVPYIQESCGECHTAKLRMPRNDSRFCLKCHEGVDQTYERMHGPVAARACLWCHHPHESALPHLLRDADRTICSQCHTPEMLDSTRVPEHADASRACLECHVGHGSPKPFMLRADMPARARKGT